MATIARILIAQILHAITVSDVDYNETSMRTLKNLCYMWTLSAKIYTIKNLLPFKKQIMYTHTFVIPLLA